MHRIISFSDALTETVNVRRHLMLGNGFSIALFPNRFHYGALLEQADFSGLTEARKAFDLLGTTDFEVVVEALKRAVQLLPLYSGDRDALQKMAAHAEGLKEILVRAIAGRHPERPSEISEAQYKACRIFLSNFVGQSRVISGAGGKSKDLRGNIYSLNYDLLLYWTLLHDQVVNWNASDPLGSFEEETEELEHDDGFRAPDGDPSAPYVAWDAEGLASETQNIHFLHGALHLFDFGAELQKRCWERGGGIALIDQIREALGAGKFPLFVSEGSSSAKLERIRHSGYLQRSLKSLARICGAKGSVLFVFGHSLADNDDHVIRKIQKGKISNLYVSFHGSPASDVNKAMFAKLQKIVEARPENSPLQFALFDAAGGSVWG